MKRTLPATVGALLFALTIGTTVHLAQSKPAPEPDFNDGVAGSSAELRNGVATYDQVASFLGVDDSELHGVRVWEVSQYDITLDGVEDLLISNHINTVAGGNVYSVFIGSAKGYRYAGDIVGEIRALPIESGKPVRFVIASFSGEGRMLVELAELQPAGLRRLAKTEMKTLGCEAEDNPTFTELVCAEKVSAETVKKVFPAKGE